MGKKFVVGVRYCPAGARMPGLGVLGIRRKIDLGPSVFLDCGVDFLRRMPAGTPALLD
jgi:hypothetical protein